MDFELDKIMAKVSGENRENMAQYIISNTDKAQIDFAFNEIFSGISLLEWMKKITLADAWKIALDKLRDFVFSIQEQSYVVDYLHNAVFEFRKKQIKQTLETSIHANEYIQCPANKYDELKEKANSKIQTGTDIIKNLLANPAYKQNGTKSNTDIIIKDKTLQQVKTKECEYERVKK